MVSACRTSPRLDEDRSPCPPSRVPYAPLRIHEDSLAGDDSVLRGRTWLISGYGDPLPHAQVLVRDLQGRRVGGAISDSLGWFRLDSALSAARYVLISRRIGVHARVDTLQLPLARGHYVFLQFDKPPWHGVHRDALRAAACR